MRRYLAVDSIFACPSSTRAVSKSPVPFKMWSAFVRRSDSLPYFLGSSPRLGQGASDRRLSPGARKLDDRANRAVTKPDVLDGQLEQVRTLQHGVDRHREESQVPETQDPTVRETRLIRLT